MLVDDRQLTAVVMIHGTFAQDENDRGARWWQRGSSFWEALASTLPDDSELPADDYALFHWSGENRWSERFGAALSLLRYLRDLDERGVSYHVIAHSHGGTVLWEALKLSTGDRAGPLRGLRTWTTVGTPFPTARSSARDVARTLILPIVVTLLVLAIILIPAFLYGVIAVPVAFGLGVWWMPFIEQRAVRRESKMSVEAATRYGGNWRGLYSRYDEAISGLTLGSSIKLRLPKKRPLSREVYEARPHLSRLRPIHQAQALMYNWFVRSWAQSFVSSRLRDAAIGNDRPGVRNWVISTSPFGLPTPSPLPAEIESEILGIADSRATSAVGALRRTLETDGTALSLSPFTLAEKGLVHTSYFESARFRDFLCQGIQRGFCRSPAGDWQSRWPGKDR